MTDTQAAVEKCKQLLEGNPDAIALAPSTLRLVLSALKAARKVIKPFGDLAEKFPNGAVVEVCEPHPGNPSPRIRALYTDHLRAAASWLKDNGNG